MRSAFFFLSLSLSLFFNNNIIIIHVSYLHTSIFNKAFFFEMMR